MVRFTVPSHLSEAQAAQSGRRSPFTVLLQDGSWPELVQEIRIQYPRLAERVLTRSDTVAAGFALVINDEVVPRGYQSLRLQNGDEFCIIATVAGG